MAALTAANFNFGLKTFIVDIISTFKRVREILALFQDTQTHCVKVCLAHHNIQNIVGTIFYAQSFPTLTCFLFMTQRAFIYLPPESRP